MADFSYTVFIVLIPLVFFILIGFFGHKFKPLVSGIFGTTGLFISWVLSIFTAWKYFFVVPHGPEGYTKMIGYNTVWLQFTEKLHIDLGVLLDPISVMMLIVITTVSFLVHFYSIGYMKGERGYHRFFSFLSLFSFSMLGLVVATNIFQMYIFWELVGVSSYLLIGFYYERDSAVAASKKAFIVTRFADLGFLIGILVLSWTTGTFDFITLTDPNGAAIHQGSSILFLGLSTMTWSMIFIFMGGAGKSAMFPLHIWLPDAMEGPTPVSALIHAATMVVAGVYLVARLFPIFHFSAPVALEVVAYVGGFTSLFAAVIACTQYDIKRVLAYSTMSQIGYMMLALGVSGYGSEEGVGYMASMFHLFTHAFFKALLFLAAGAIIHAVHSNYMYDMGGLRKKLPITFWTFFMAWLAIAGIPPLAGFFSKDEILVACWMNNKILFFNAIFVAGLTAFYMSRLFFRVFFGKDQHYHHEPHEAHWTMTVPLMLLSLGAMFAGFVPFSKLVTSDGKPFETEFHLGIALPAILVGVLGIGIAYIFYFKESDLPGRIGAGLKGFYRAAFHKFYIDEVYLFITKKIIFNNVSRPIAWFDRHIVDGSMNGISYVTNQVSDRIKGLQSGQLQQYAWVFVSGVIALALAFIYLWF
jgi:NADH-quinone oxidoreductase subunit L